MFAMSFILGNVYNYANSPPSPAECELERRQHQADVKLWDSERRRWDREVVQHRAQHKQWEHEQEEIRKDRAESLERHREIVKRETDLQHELAIFNRDRLRLEREKNEMSKTRGQYEADKRIWDADRATWARDRDDWERERRERESVPHVHPAGAHWDIPVPSKECHSYGKREYSARLWDIPSGWTWLEACRVTPIRIDGVLINQPDRCEDNGFWGGVVGRWIVEEDEESLCRPWFDAKKDQGCVASKLRRHEAPIVGLQRNDNWEVMCATTPDADYQRPKYCVNKPYTTHRTGVWESFDESC